MKRFLCLLIAMLVMLPMTACGDAVDTGSADTETETTVDTTETEPTLQLPELDYEGYSFHIYSFDHSAYRIEHVAEELNGDVLNDAIFNRNLDVSTLLNVELITVINKWDNDDFRSNVMAAVMSGSDDYDVFTGNMYNTTYLSAEGYFYNLNRVPFISVENPWWNKSCYEELSIGNNAYLLMGDMCLSNYNAEAVFFNRSMIEDYNMEDPYTLAYENEWTIDKMIEMTKDFYIDRNGNGVRDEDGSDLYGFHSKRQSSYSLAHYYIDITTKTPDNYIEVTFHSERTEELFNKLRTWMMESAGSYCPRGWTSAGPLVEEQSCVFTILTLNQCANLREYDVNYGVVPIPKYDKTQENYISTASGLLVCFPSSISDIERSAAVADALSYYGREYVYPAYVEKSILSKGIRDEDAQFMIETILDNVKYNFGVAFGGFDGYGYALLDYTDGNQGFGSFYAAMSTAADKELYDYADKILALD
ncbi:MAG: hypothetical protein IKY52_13025 [Clostridia bacterium]|nr:hypothetical protein [Clostridia bacterium]